MDFDPHLSTNFVYGFLMFHQSITEDIRLFARICVSSVRVHFQTRCQSVCTEKFFLSLGIIAISAFKKFLQYILIGIFLQSLKNLTQWLTIASTLRGRKCTKSYACAAGSDLCGEKN